MTEEKPVVYILRGDDQQSVNGHIANFCQGLGNADMADMNTTRLDGKSVTLNDLRAAALAMPFLTVRRLVIVENALQPYAGRGKQKERQDFLELLDALPVTTALVLVVPDVHKYSYAVGWGWELLKETHWLIKWVRKSGGRGLIIDCALPPVGKMPDWIIKKAIELGGEFSPEAAQALRDFIGNDTRQAVHEITKLLTYVDFKRPVVGEDVGLLTVRDQQSDIFTMVDAIGHRDGQKALETLRIIQDEMDFIPLFAMVIRQFRLLVQAREILDLSNAGYFQQPTQQTMTRLLGEPDFVAKRIFEQAKNFDLATLQQIYDQLLDIDLGEKTGQMPGEVALDLLIARLAG